MTPNAKITWQERVRDTDKYHRQLVRSNPKHRICDTAKLLHRSTGSIAEDLLLASWFNTHPKVAEFKTMFEALLYVRERKIEMRMR